MKISATTLKKYVLSSSASHTSSASNSTRAPISSQLYNKEITTNENTKNNLNTDDIHSYVTTRKKNYSGHATYTTTNLTTLNATLPIAPVQLNTTKKLPPDGKEYLCFQINGK